LLEYFKAPNKHKLCHHNSKEATLHLSVSTDGSLFFSQRITRVGTDSIAALAALLPR